MVKKDKKCLGQTHKGKDYVYTNSLSDFTMFRYTEHSPAMFYPNGATKQEIETEDDLAFKRKEGH